MKIKFKIQSQYVYTDPNPPFEESTYFCIVAESEGPQPCKLELRVPRNVEVTSPFYLVDLTPAQDPAPPPAPPAPPVPA